MRILGVFATCAAALVAQAPAGKQEKAPAAAKGKAAPVPEWRRSLEKFREEVNAFAEKATEVTSDKRFPAPSFNFMGRGGEVPAEWEVMRLFGGEVEWESIFDGLEEEENLEGRPKKVKLDVAGMVVPLYPSASSAPKWEALSIGSTVRFRAYIEGIAGMDYGLKSKTTGDRVWLLYVSAKTRSCFLSW
jgi:hypothetical protein